MTLDYRKFYWLEEYLFTDVRRRFAKTRDICPANFYMITIWKANPRQSTKRRFGGNGHDPIWVKSAIAAVGKIKDVAADLA